MLFIIFPFFIGGYALFLGSNIAKLEVDNYNENQVEFIKPDFSSTSPQTDINRDIIDYKPIESTLNWSKTANKALDPLENATDTVEYDLRTGAEKVSSRDDTLYITYPSIVEPFEGIVNANYWFDDANEKQEGGLQSSFVFPPDDRQEITDTTLFPWSSICKLYIDAHDGSHYIGSGAIIDEFHILTVGHCVYIHDAGGWVDGITIVPGMDGSYEPFGAAYATYMRTYQGWIQSEMVEHDWAVVTLDRSIGQLTGWMGRETEPYTSSVYTGTLNTAGYPGDLDFGEVMYYCTDNGDRADEYNHWFWMDTAGGQSGSPIWRYDGSNRYILSILAYEYLGGIDANFGTRLNTDKYNQIITWLAEDNGTLLNDKPDLLDRGYYSRVSKTKLITGETIFEIDCEVANEGTLEASSFNVSFYVSTNTVISQYDYLLGNITISHLDPFTYIALNWTGIVPTEVPDGSYYVGWLIDSGDDIQEFDENNNEGLISYPLVEIESPAPPNQDGFLIPTIIILAVASLVSLTVIIIAVVRRNRRKEAKAFSLYETQPYISSDYQVATSYEPRGFKFCTNCGYMRLPNSMFCVNCGYKFPQDI